LQVSSDDSRLSKEVKEAIRIQVGAFGLLSEQTEDMIRKKRSSIIEEVIVQKQKNNNSKKVQFSDKKTEKNDSVLDKY
jgi:hypothetical protein